MLHRLITYFAGAVGIMMFLADYVYDPAKWENLFLAGFYLFLVCLLFFPRRLERKPYKTTKNSRD